MNQPTISLSRFLVHGCGGPTDTLAADGLPRLVKMRSPFHFVVPHYKTPCDLVYSGPGDTPQTLRRQEVPGVAQKRRSLVCRVFDTPGRCVPPRRHDFGTPVHIFPYCFNGSKDVMRDSLSTLCRWNFNCTWFRVSVIHRQVVNSSTFALPSMRLELPASTSRCSTCKTPAGNPVLPGRGQFTIPPLIAVFALGFRITAFPP